MVTALSIEDTMLHIVFATCRCAISMQFGDVMLVILGVRRLATVASAMPVKIGPTTMLAAFVVRGRATNELCGRASAFDTAYEMCDHTQGVRVAKDPARNTVVARD